MARKRMISPSIWNSRSFSKLSDFTKIVFISLFSHADDEGRGTADPAYIKSITFPWDGDKKRVADIQQALSQIALHMSVQFYSVDGEEYYFMTKWTEYQKIDKPTKSKLPPPPNVGVGGAIPNRGQFGEYSGSIRGVVGEDSTPNTIQYNTIQDDVYLDNKNTYLLRAREEWEEIVDKQVCLENQRMCCEAAYGDDEIHNLVLNTLLDMLVAGKDITVGDKVYAFEQIAQAVENMERNVFAEIEGAFCKVDTETNKIMKKQISNPTNYIVTLLMAKSR